MGAATVTVVSKKNYPQIAQITQIDAEKRTNTGIAFSWSSPSPLFSLFICGICAICGSFFFFENYCHAPASPPHRSSSATNAIFFGCGFPSQYQT